MFKYEPARDPELRIRDIAILVGITERATVQILGQLETSAYLTKTVSGPAPALRHRSMPGRTRSPYAG